MRDIKEITEREMDLGKVIDKIVEMKSRDYVFIQKTEKEVTYMDEDNNVLVLTIKEQKGITYVLEMENMCQFNLYEWKGNNAILKVLGIYDENKSKENKEAAYEVFRRYRDSNDIKSEVPTNIRKII